MTDRDPEQTRSTGMRRMSEFVATIPGSMQEEVQRLPQEAGRGDVAPGAKIFRIHLVADHLYASVDGHVACARGCAHCCYLGLAISRTEAQYIGERIGRAPVDIRGSRTRDATAFSYATPCSFLRGGECSIYEHRPLACREAYNFDEDSYWCRHENWRKPGAAVPRPTFPGLREAYKLAAAEKDGSVFADIRDFFPPAPAGTDAGK